MFFAFNELSDTSIRSCADLDRFYEQIRKLEQIARLDKFPSIVFTDDFTSKNYNGLGTTYDLLKDSKLEKDELDHFKSIIVNSPFSSKIQSNEDEYTFNSYETKGFQYSVINNIRSISIPGPCWSKYNYTVVKTSICSTTTNIITSYISFEHLGDLNSIQGTWLQHCLPVTTFTNAREFLANIPQKYPDVILSTNAQNGLTSFNQGKLNQLERAMSIFQQYCKNYWNGTFRMQAITKLGVAIKDETKQTMAKYGNQRIFENENGQNEIIQLHFNISEDFRGNIKPTNNKKIYIAYLGPHLSTVKFK
ncbi:hypothetical protein ACPFTV_000743 [Vibrio cholerae]